MTTIVERSGEQVEAPAVSVAAPRLVTLDSLRGIAAFTVMIHHYLLTFPTIYPYGQARSPLVVQALEFSPLHLLWAGYEAVLLFFVLSGFVLALPYWSGVPFSYGPFIARRLARVWIPYMAVVSLAGLLGLALAPLYVPGMSSWFNGAWRDVSWEGYINHLLLIGNLEPVSGQFIPVVWSLKYEMLASLAFPLLLALVRFLSWPTVLALGALLNALGYLYPSSLRPFQFVLMFLVGILLARHKDALIQAFRRLPRLSHVPVLALALGLYICTWLGWHEDRRTMEAALLDWGITAAAAFAVIAALASSTARRLLTWPPIVWLGRVSYSVYLSHTLVLLAVVHLLGRSIPVWSLLIVCVPLTLLVSGLLYRWVELPAIAFGRQLSRRRFL